jgi:hypothetical protein
MASRARHSSKPKAQRGTRSANADTKTTNRKGEPKKSPKLNGLTKPQLRQLRANERAAGKRAA